MALTLNNIVCDAAEPKELAEWWCAHFAGELQIYNQDFVGVKLPGAHIEIWFQRQTLPTPGKNRLHLDLHAEDLEQTVAELVADGAALVAEHVEPTFSWTVLADPEGNQFCVSQKK